MATQTQLNLRGMDPTTLEVTLMDALSLPVGRVSPVDLVHMFALAETEGVPKSVRKDLQKFSTRIENEVADLPDGGQLKEMIIALQDVPGEQIPEQFRKLVQREANRGSRDAGERALMQSLVDALADVEPETFPVGQGRGPAILKTEQAPPPSSLKAGTVSSSTKKSGGKSSRTKTPTRSARAIVVEDPEQTRWLRTKILERLSGYSETGLAEMVLMAGIRHAAREEYPRLMPTDISKVLKDLKESGQLRYSAGRWSVPGRW